MKPCCHPRTSRSPGLSVPEVLIACALFSMVLASLAYIMREGIRFFNNHNTALEVQQQCLQAMDRLGSELGEASLSCFEGTRISSPPESGLIWGSFKDENSVTKTDLLTGEPMWQKHIGYYTARSDGKPILLRKEIKLTSPTTDIPPVYPFLDFKSDTGTATAVVARHIVELTSTSSNPTKIEMKADYQNGRFTLKLQTYILLQN